MTQSSRLCVLPHPIFQSGKFATRRRSLCSFLCAGARQLQGPDRMLLKLQSGCFLSHTHLHGDDFSSLTACS